MSTHTKHTQNGTCAAECAAGLPHDTAAGACTEIQVTMEVRMDLVDSGGATSDAMYPDSEATKRFRNRW